MAANSSNTIRLRLYFDYPPPAVSDHRMCWLLVDLNKCRVVADLESVIRDKFDISRKSILNLFIDNCYLPHTESVYVVRDNDRISVNIDSLVMTNGHGSDQVERKSSKKSRRYSHVEPEGNDIFLECKKKKRKKMTEGSLNGETEQSLGTIRDEGSQKKQKKRKEKTPQPSSSKAPLTPKPSSSKAPLTPSGQHINKTPRRKPVDINGIANAKQVSSSDSSDGSSEEDTAALNLTSKVQKTLPIKVPVAPTPPMVPLKSKPATEKKSQQNCSSSSSVCSSDKAQGETASKPSTVPPSASSDSDSDSEEEIKLVIKRPLLARQGIAVEACMSARGRGRGRAQPRGRPGVTSGNLEGRVGKGFHLNSDEEERRPRPPLYEKDSLTNHSVMLQNAYEPPPKKDYSTMPLLAAPPSVGQRIVFKLLELTENYTPEVSEYKEGKILHFDHATKQVELELLNSWQAPAEPGKFDLVYQNADGSESVEYAVSRSGSQVTEHWDSLLEPRLVL